MHVLVVTVVHHPLDARICQRQIPALLAAGHRVTFAAPWTETGTSTTLPMTCLDLPRASGRRRLAALQAARRLLAVTPADVVVLHDPELLLAAPRARSGVVIWDVHEDTVAALPDKPWLPAWAAGPVRIAFRAAEHLAERRLHLLLAEAGYRQRFRRDHPVVPNDTAVPQVVPPSAAGRAVFIGRLSHGRGALDMVQAARRLAPHIAVDLIGPADADVRPALVAADADGVLRWHGFVPNEQALRMVEGATAGLSLLHDAPNYRHSRPTKVIEYLAHGVPVVTTPLPAAREIVERAHAGVVVPFGDPEAAAGAVRRLSEDDQGRRAMAARGHAAARESYDWARSGAEFVALLEAWAGIR